MLRIIQNSHAAGAKSYYSTADYYCEGEQELSGRWRGQAADKLGLSGVVQKHDWDALCDGIHPQTRESLLLRRNDNRTVGYDFNFHVPKSVLLSGGVVPEPVRLGRTVRWRLEDIHSWIAAGCPQQAVTDKRR
jgi:conjugative relaxase-like TrwC/TraI family protein